MPIKLPQNNAWIQTNKSDTLGSLLGSFNLDLMTVMGNARISRTLQSVSQTNLTTMTDYPVGFRRVTDGSGGYKIVTVAGTRVFTNGGATNGNFSLDATSGTPTDCSSATSDIEFFNNSIYVTGGSSLYKYTGTAWSTNGTSISSGLHCLCSYGDRLYISKNSNQIVSIDTSDVMATAGAQYTIDRLGRGSDANIITWMRAASNRIWIGTLNAVSGKSYVAEWDGSANQVTRTYRIEAQGVLSCVIKDDVPWIMDSNGKLWKFENGTFVEKARLPLFNKFLLNATALTNTRFIHPNGMTIHNGKINLLISNTNSDNDQTINEFCPSGIWEYDESVGLYHRFSLSYTTVGTNDITDYGQNRVYRTGGLSEMRVPGTAANDTGSLLAGAVIYKDATTTDAGIFLNETFSNLTGTYKCTQKAGYLVTTKIQPQGVTDIWSKIYVKYHKLLSSSDKIVVKYRTSDPDPTEINITWLNTNSFITTTNLTTAGYAVGDEVEITQGTGGGMCSHIETIQITDSGSMVTLDETHTGVTTGTAKARLQKWTKLEPAITDQNSQYVSLGLPIGATSTWIEIKIFFLFTGDGEFEELDLASSPSQKII